MLAVEFPHKSLLLTFFVFKSAISSLSRAPIQVLKLFLIWLVCDN